MSSFVRHLETMASPGRRWSCDRTFSTTLISSVVVCLITSHWEDAPLFRIPVPSGRTTGLKVESQVMVDKMIAIQRSKITGRAGTLPGGVLKEVDHALRLWLELG